MKINEQAKILLLEESCYSCGNSLPIDNTIMCVYSSDLSLGKAKPLPKVLWCKNYYKDIYGKENRDTKTN